MRIAPALLVLLVAASLLGACGRAGSIRPAGPPEEVNYPRVYPAR